MAIGRPQVFPGYCGISSCQVGLSMETAFFLQKWKFHSQDSSTQSFYNLIFTAVPQHFRCILRTTSEAGGRAYIQGEQTLRKSNHLKPSKRLPITDGFIFGRFLVLQIYRSVLIPVPHYFVYCSLKVTLELGQVYSPMSLSSHNGFTTPLLFHKHFRINLTIFTKNWWEFCSELCQNYINLWRNDILILSLPIHENPFFSYFFTKKVKKF